MLPGKGTTAARKLMIALVACAAVFGSPEGLAPCVTRELERGLRAQPQPLRLRGGDGSSAFESRLYARSRSHQQAPTTFLGRLFSAARSAPAKAGEELTWGVAAPTVLFAAAAAGIAVEATKTMQTLSDEQCLRHIEKWKRSGQAPSALLQTIIKGSCFHVEDSEDELGSHDASAWFAVMKVAVERGHAQTLRCLVSEQVGGIHVGLRGRHGQTALHVAAARGRERIIDLLCELGADVECTDMLGWSPLHQAAYYGRTAAVRRLVEQHNASAKAVTSDGLTPLALAVEQMQRPEASSPTLSAWGDGTDSARDAEVRKASLEETVRYLGSVQSRTQAVASWAASSPQTSTVSAGGSKWAGLLRRIAALGRTSQSKGAIAKAGASGISPATAAAAGAETSARSDIQRAVDRAWGAGTDQSSNHDRAGAAEGGMEASTADAREAVAAGSSGNSAGIAAMNGSPARTAGAGMAASPKETADGSPPSSLKASAAVEAPAAEKSGRDGADAQEPAMCGVGITLNINVDGEYVIKAVAPDGPADVRSKVGGKALISPGDILEGVDGRAVRDVSYADLARRILGPAGSKVQVAVRKGSKVSKLSLTRSPLGDGAQQAVKQGIVREQTTLKHMLRMAKKLEKEKKAMANEISELRIRAEAAENEARVWKAISQQASQATSQTASPAHSDYSSAEEL